MAWEGCWRTHPFAGSHILRTTLSNVSIPPSFRALVTDLDPCSLVANSRSPQSRWSRVIFRWFSEPCSKTAAKVKIEGNYGREWKPYCAVCSKNPTGFLLLRQRQQNPGWEVRRRCRLSRQPLSSRKHANKIVFCVSMIYIKNSWGPTWTTREPVSWQAKEAHLPWSDLLTLYGCTQIIIPCGGIMTH